MQLNAIQKTCKVLESMYDGNTVEVGEDAYCMNDDNEIGIPLYDAKGEKTENMITIDFELNAFIKMCSNISELDMLGIIANKVLQKQQ
ncbi:hypothetical protein [Clostridium tagluense]|uniref:Uncharacterized protein n=1 Tax=Clostridium tagluense TaxID=360422 RepID=A0A401UTQ5_9CLOT|nr:hypothetical protein [Clostridium tagluense]GCD12894.1 hypothetical protein Ctaglu_45170 [Clostridium tagluense]